MFFDNALFSLYVLINFLVAFIVNLGFFYLFQSSFIEMANFSLFWLVGNYYYYICPAILRPIGAAPRMYFLFQVLGLIGLGFQLQMISPLYLAFIPCAQGMIFLAREGGDTQKGIGQGEILFFLGLGIFFIFEGVNQSTFIGSADGILLAAFLCWSLALFIVESDWARKGGIARILKFAKKIQANSLRPVRNTKDDQFFFHDLINHTHTILLFLKSHGKKGIDERELNDVVLEMRLLQSVIQDHFHLNHKNLFNTLNLASFNEAIAILKNVVETYLPDQNVHYLFTNGTEIESHRAQLIVDVPVFYRIMNNVVKNIAEAQSTEVEFIFESENRGLKIVIKNNIKKLNHYSFDLAKILSESIAKERTALAIERGLGLESVCELIRRKGGDFHFEVQGHFWVTTIIIPQEKSKVLAA